ncbi:ARPP-2 domain-containing protein [Corallococcus llansteffanensis]|uniref:ARG and Rhodanese-Phosphatase-superfamily-associated domain-containing protein n=1 Tax=Corallococcus llansteffanensis TaxID=2316731 RepID=A0A3A8QIH5_9BACT|nr:hypothetical protein [Corallococcus llansteffanensis]RKH67698.1 hypothetical protein D7V93_02470 [Corallococcus llansteffanensis]
MREGHKSAVRRLPLTGLRLAPSQVWGSIRLVPVLRDDIPGDLRITRRSYDEDVSVVSLQGGLMETGLHYTSYVPHGLVVDWDDKGTAVTPETRLRKPGGKEGKSLKHGPFSTRVLHRMVHREDKNRLRLLPMHLTMEGFLALYFGGPEVAWNEYSQEALSQGLNPRSEGSFSGWASAAFAEALRIFELHERQVGMLIFQADALLSCAIVSHPEDYRALHRALLEDFYGELLMQYGFLGDVPVLGLGVEDARVNSMKELRAAIERMRVDWADFMGFMAEGVIGAEVVTSPVYEAGPFHLQRFITGLSPSEENHMGEAILRGDGTVEYLKTYRLSAAQTRRAYLLKQLAQGSWNLERTAAQLKTTRDELMVRLRNAGFGYLLKEHVLKAAETRFARR